MAKWLKRSRAQSRDPDARREAVEHDPPDSLGQALEYFAREDSAAGVRKAALRRAADLALSRERMHDDSDPGVRELAEKLYRELLTGKHPKTPDLPQRLKLLAGITEAELLEHLACEADEPALREAALRKLDRPGLLVKRLLDDPDRELRLRLLNDIDDAEQLQRIADKARRRDRQLQRQAEARLHALQLAAGDRNAIQAEAEWLCRELERMPGAQASRTEIESLDARWQAIQQAVDPVLVTRHDNARAQALAAAQAPDKDRPEPDTAARILPRMDEPEHPSGRVEKSPPEVQKLAAEHRFQASLAASEPAVPATRPKSGRTKAAPALEPLLGSLEAALEQGNLAAADEHMRQLLAHQRELPRKLAARWHRAHNRVAEMKRWQQWSSRRQRRQLCVEARAMRGSQLHPEAIANRIRELRQTWKQLDALEPAGAPAHAADTALQRRFHALCQRALEPTRAWFEQRDALRRERTQQIEALLRAESPDPEDWKSMASHRRHLAAARRELDKVEPRARKSLARKLTRAIKRIDEPLDAHYQSIREAHEHLIVRARALLELAPHERPGAARELQKQWQGLGPGRPDLDRRQWRPFRAALDAVFVERERERKAQDEKRHESLQQARGLLEELEAGTSSADEPELLRTRLRDARQAWRKLDVRDRALARSFDDLCNTIEQRVHVLEAQARRQRWQAWVDAARAGEPADDMPPALREAVAAAGKGSFDADGVRELLLRLEALAGVDSPAAEHDARMQINLERLQARLGNGRRESLQSELESLLAGWVRKTSDTAPAADIQQRFETALDAILARIH